MILILNLDHDWQLFYLPYQFGHLIDSNGINQKIILFENFKVKKWPTITLIYLFHKKEQKHKNNDSHLNQRFLKGFNQVVIQEMVQ